PGGARPLPRAPRPGQHRRAGDPRSGDRRHGRAPCRAVRRSHPPGSDGESGMSTSGAFRERLGEAWTELRENPGRSFLQALGVMLGVASVLGGFSISDSQRQQSARMFAKTGGTDKLNVLPTDTVYQGTPSALHNANLGLRLEDAVE